MVRNQDYYVHTSGVYYYVFIFLVVLIGVEQLTITEIVGASV